MEVVKSKEVNFSSQLPTSPVGFQTEKRGKLAGTCQQTNPMMFLIKVLLSYAFNYYCADCERRWPLPPPVFICYIASSSSTGPATVGPGVGQVPGVHRQHRNPAGQSGEQSRHQTAARGHQDQGDDRQGHAEGGQEDVAE